MTKIFKNIMKDGKSPNDVINILSL